jgi:Sensors of blue-light using FAD
MISLLYVSRAAFQSGSEDRQLISILAAARQRNPSMGITGALIHMSGYFAQVLEGEAPPVNQLMIDILRDRRHSEVRIIEVVPVSKRRFADWSMGWVPPSPGPRGYLETLARAGPDARTGEAAAALIDYMTRFAEGPEGSR